MLKWIGAVRPVKLRFLQLVLNPIPVVGIAVLTLMVVSAPMVQGALSAKIWITRLGTSLRP